MKTPASLTILALALTMALTQGCAQNQEELVSPNVLRAPLYPSETPGDVLWAVAPLANESGVSIVDELVITDTLLNQIHQVKGISVVPLNRTIGAMRVAGLNRLSSPEEALELAELLGVDAIVVGSITAWDPYNPPRIGFNLALFVRPGSMGYGGDPLSPAVGGMDDPIAFSTSTAGDTAWQREAESSYGTSPTSVASDHLDGASHEVQMAVRSYAYGRTETVSALGWRRYLASMPLFADFACFEMTDRLLDAESRRLLKQSAAAEPGG